MYCNFSSKFKAWYSIHHRLYTAAKPALYWKFTQFEIHQRMLYLSGKYCNHPTILQEGWWNSARGDIVRYFPSARRIVYTCQGNDTCQENNIHLPGNYFLPARRLSARSRRLPPPSQTWAGRRGLERKKNDERQRKTRTTTAMKTTTNQTHPPLQWWQSQCCLGDQRQCCWHSQPVL